MSPRNSNKPTCILCKPADERRAVHIGVWICKRHWRLVVRLVKLSPAKLVWSDPDLRDAYARIQRPHDNPTDKCVSPTLEAKPD